MTRAAPRLGGATAAAALVAAQLAPMPAVLAPVGAGTARAESYRTISCTSRGMGQTNCRIPNGVTRVTLASPQSAWACREGETWGWGGARLWVRGGCGGIFQLALGGSGGFGGSGGSWGGSGGSWGGSGGSWQGDGFAGELRCRSDRGRERFCRADVRNHAVLVQQLSGAPCIEGETWRPEAGGIRVRGSCDGQFAYGYGGFYPAGWHGGGNWRPQPQPQHGRDGPDAGAIVAGGLLAAGLVAALAAAGKSSSASNAGMANVEANLSAFPDRSRREARACLNEAARQVGATGGSRVRLERVLLSEQQPGGGWRHEAQVMKTWPGHSQRFVMDCIASGDRVSAFDVR